MKQQSEKESLGQSMFADLFMDELRDIYSAEKQLTKALPELKAAATTEDLATAFDEHLRVTQNQISRLEQIFSILGEKPDAKECQAMKGLIKEGQEVIGETEEGTATRDVGLIICAQKVEHYEIAAYGSLRQLARTAGNQEVAQLLEQTLEEEKATDMLLSNLAETRINEEAREENA